MKIELNELTTGYGTKVVTEKINATLSSGKLVCLLGNNGTGKSTLLRTLCGFQPALSGDMILVDEGVSRSLSTYNNKEKARIIGVVLTDRIDAEHMTVRDLVMMGRLPYMGFWGRPQAEDERITDEALRLVGITSFASRLVSTLSDGERQKAVIAKTLAQQTPVIFLDEPSAFLDYPSKVDLMNLLHRIAEQEHKIVLISTHDVEIATRTAHEAWLLEGNSKLCCLSPEEALRYYVPE